MRTPKRKLSGRNSARYFERMLEEANRRVDERNGYDRERWEQERFGDDEDFRRNTSSLTYEWVRLRP